MRPLALATCAASIALACNGISGVGDLRFDESQGEGGEGDPSATTTASSTGSAGGTGGGSPASGSGGASSTASTGGNAGAGGTGGAAQPPPTCAEQYGDVSGYIACNETATECSFAASLQGITCNTLCLAQGGTCIDAIDNRTNTCNFYAESDCSTGNLANQICVCTRGCAGGPACISPESCAASGCQ